ncbi:MAG: hypothetical protein RR630_08855 [Coprobacillus sp.]
MLKDGDIVYFLVNGYIMNGTVVHIKEKGKDYTFQIDGYGGCGGQHIISSIQIHHTIFLSEQEANLYKDNPQMYLQISC